MSPAARRHAALVIALALSACASVAPVAPVAVEETPEQAAQRRAEAPRPTYNLAGYPPPLRDGYIDGCEAAKASAHGRKDAKRFAAEPQYAMGWNDGYSICSKR